MAKLTANFYDADTGEYIEIEDGKVVARHQSILTKQERLTINRERAERLITQQASIVTETPLVQPEMFPVANADQVSYGSVGNTMPELTWDEPKPNYPGQGTPPENQQEEPLVAPVMTWD
jgi:hypothetical protein